MESRWKNLKEIHLKILLSKNPGTNVYCQLSYKRGY